MPEPRPSTAVSVVVVAAGRGTRMGADGNKVLLELGDAPILVHTLDALARPGVVDEIVLVVRSEERAAMEDLCARVEPALPPVRFAQGGAERADSVANGVAAATSPDLVLVHDAARPFVLPSLLHALVTTASRRGAAIPVLPVVDTLKRRRDDLVAETVDRRDLVRAQTPQAFRVAVLRDALARRSAGDPPTDDAAAVEAVGGDVALVDGDALNLKITTPDDLRLAHAILPLFRTRRDEELRA